MLRYGLVIFVIAAAGCSGAADMGDDSGSGGDGATSATGGSSGSAGNSGSAGSSGSNAAGSSAGLSSGKGGAANQGGDGPEAGERGSGGARSGAGGTGGAGGSTSGGAGKSGGTGSGGVSTNHTNPLSQELINAFVKAHNDARAGNLAPTPSPALPPVAWDAALADAAYNYLSKCVSGDGSLVDHNDNRTKDYASLGGSDYVGENIYASSANSIDPADAVNEWMSEASDYAEGNVSGAGHYTQVVWRDSVRIGCAIVNCPSVRFHNTVLCDYAPGGNISGQTPY